MKDFRIYMAAGGMPQAAERYIATNNLESVDKVKREILNLYCAGFAARNFKKRRKFKEKHENQYKNEFLLAISSIFAYNSR